MNVSPLKIRHVAGEISPDVCVGVARMHVLELAVGLALAQHILSEACFGLCVVAINTVLQVAVLLTQKVEVVRLLLVQRRSCHHHAPDAIVLGTLLHQSLHARVELGLGIDILRFD